MHIGLFGGSFDPIHHGHLIIARSLLEQAGLDRVILLPTHDPPHKDAAVLADAAHRLEMIRLAIAGDPQFELSDYDMVREGPTYTVDTVQHFQSLFGGDTSLSWIIGADSLAELATWHRVSDLVDRCRVLTASRPHSVPVDWGSLSRSLSPPQIAKLKTGVYKAPLIDISATGLRTRLADGKSVRYFVPLPVWEYLERTGLYTKK